MDESDRSEIDDMQSMLYYEFNYIDTYELDPDTFVLLEE